MVTLPSECRQREVTKGTFHAKRSEGKGTMEWSLSRASAGNVRLHPSPLGATKEAKPPGSRVSPGVWIPFIHATTPWNRIKSFSGIEISQIMYFIMTVFHQKYKAKNPTLFRLTDVFDSTTIGTLGLEKRNGV